MATDENVPADRGYVGHHSDRRGWHPRGLTEIRDLLHATSETLERIVNNQDEIILLLGALLDVTAGDQPPSRTRSARTD